MQSEVINGRDGIKTLFERILACKEKELRSALSGKPLVYFVSRDFADSYMRRRVETGIFLRSLRFTDKTVDDSKHTDYKKFNKEARIAPKESTLDNSILIWDDCVATIDTKSIQGVIVTDSKYAQQMKDWFDKMWGTSKPY